jgi:hypothetical protein
LIIATLGESLIVLYAMSLGVKDSGVLKISGPLPITISPLFHLVPIAVIITLFFTWIYLTKQLSARSFPTAGKSVSSAFRRTETKQPPAKTAQTAKASAEGAKQGRAEARGLSYLMKKTRLGNMTAKSALLVFIAFLVLVLVISLLAFPTLLFQVVSSTYQDKSPMYIFVVAIANALRGFANGVPPIGWIAGAVNNGLLALAPGFGTIGRAFGSLIVPLANVDSPGKYLLFQNLAMLISVISVLFYSHYPRRGYRYRKK